MSEGVCLPVQMGSDRSKWPTVARDDEFGRAWAALDDNSAFQGVALVGDSGVGKSTLARALGQALELHGRTVRFALGTQTGSAVPLGAFSPSVTADAADQPATMLAAAHKTLEQEDNLVVVVDDAHLLDPLSATLVYQLAAGRTWVPISGVAIGTQVLDGILLPVLLVFIIVLANDRRLLGRRRNGPIYNLIAVALAAVLSVLTAFLVVTSFLPSSS